VIALPFPRPVWNQALRGAYQITVSTIPRSKSGGWTAKLSSSIALKDGRELVTLSDARACLIRHFDNVVRSAPLAHAIELLIAATESSKKADREAATVQIQVVLRSRGLLSS
jgi:hypothetical protein